MQKRTKITKSKLHHGQFSKVNLVICALVFAGVGLYTLFYTRAAGPVPVSSYVELGTHPQAAAQATADGKVLHYLAVYNNKIYAAYGDRVNNTGPIAINPFNPATGQFEGVEFTDATEIIDLFRTINGKLYAPDGDPFGGNGGYSVGVPWSQRQPVSALHILDIASLTGTDLWLAGYDATSGKLWRSTDGGATWSVALNDPGQIAYYWMGVVGGKLVTQAFGSNTSRIFNGTAWTNGPDINFYISYPEMFKGKMITREMGLSSFDGTTLTYIPGFGPQTKTCSTPPCSDAVSMATDGDYFYVLKKDQTVVRTTDLSTWETVATAVPTTAASMTVYNNYLYFGTTDSKLLRTSTQVDSTVTPPPSPPPSGNKVGDINSDGSVNIFDLSILLSNYDASTASCDINSDNIVNIFDLSILLSHYGT